MFRRKEEGEISSDNATTQPKTGNNDMFKNAPSSGSARPASATSNSTEAPKAPGLRTPAPGVSRIPEVKPAQAAPTPAPAEDTPPAPKAQHVLTVGPGILLKGEIATCDRLVIEGEVDAKLNKVHTVEIANTGSFKGAASIENAEISGTFEGDLEVRGRLVITTTGKVRGNITYGEIEIQRGGTLIGQIQTTEEAKNNKASAKTSDKKAA